MGLEAIAALALLTCGQAMERATLDLKHVGLGVGERGQDSGIPVFGKAAEPIGGEGEGAKPRCGALNGFGHFVDATGVCLAQEVEREVDVGGRGQTPLG